MIRVLTENELKFVSGASAGDACMDDFSQNHDIVETLFTGIFVCGIVVGIETAIHIMLVSTTGALLGSGIGLYAGASTLEKVGLGIAGGILGGYAGGIYASARS